MISHDSYLISKASMISIAVFVLIFPFSVKIAVIGIILHFLLTIGVKREKLLLKQVPAVLIASMLFYIHHIAGLFYTTNIEHGLSDAETKAAFFIFPVIAIFLPRTAGERDYFRKAWVLSLTIASAYLVVKSVMNYVRLQDPSVFYYDSFSSLMHPTYFTMMLNIALLFHIDDWKKSVKTVSKKYFYIHYSIFTILVASAALSSSRAAIVVMVVTVLFYLMMNRSHIPGLGLSALMLALVSVIIFGGPRFNLLVNEAMNDTVVNDSAKVDHTPIAHRITLWKTALQVAKNNPLGTGSGDVVDELVVEYRKIHFDKAVTVQYNPHNQYLQTAIALGITGLIILLMMLVPLGLTIFLRPDSLIPGLIAVIVGLNALFESVFEVQKGVLMFALMLVFAVNKRIISK